MEIFACILFFVSFTSAFVVEEECLNYTVYPVQYDLTLDPYIYADGRSYYNGRIIITIIANAPNINVIELDAKDLEINSGSVQVFDKNINLVNEYRPYEFDKSRGKLYIYLRQPLQQYSVSRTQYFIHISFSKTVELNSDGIFVVKYENEQGNSEYLYTTRLAPNRAKYFFPCFDNPQFEAVFKFKVNILPPRRDFQQCNTTLVIANKLKEQRSEDNYTVIESISSPQVALHQVGFHHSNFGHREITAKNINDTLKIWAPVQFLKHYTFIIEFGKTIIDLIHEYASINRPLVYGPINIVGVPKILNGYEICSWNLLTIGNNRLANIYKYTSIKQIQQMEFELAQQLSRIWLGNPGELQRTRWKEEWFKEGISNYIAFYLLAQYNHGYVIMGFRRPIDIYGIQMKHKAMAVDWHHSTPALATFNRTLAIEIPSRYKELVAMKTASLLWMVENWLGSEKFHQALIKYINSKRGQYISLADFMTNLDLDTVECLHQFFNGSTSSRVLSSWFHQSRYPVVNVQVFRDRDPNAIQLKQKKFSLIEHEKTDSNYLIPISYIVQNNENCFNCFQPRFTIGMQTYTFRENLNGGWIILNRNASGYYRVNYDEQTWRLIAKTLKEDHSAINELNRAEIVNDVLALYAAGDLHEDISREVLDYLNKEISFFVWESVITGFEFLKIEDVKMTKTLYGEWQQFMQNKISSIYRRLFKSTEQYPKTRLFRSSIIEFACELKYKQCLDDMREHYENFYKYKARLNPDFREACYYNIMQNGANKITSKLNIFELEDKNTAEHKFQNENRFLYRIPVGEPRPSYIIKTTTTTTSTTENSVTSSQMINKGMMSTASLFFIILGIFLNLMNNN
ncbi:unnamed protein product, partial [Brenthis ino]